MSIQIINGNLITLADEGEFDVICHGCNCQGTMGAGIAKHISNRWPLVAKVDRCVFERCSNTYDLLGDMSMCKVDTNANTKLVIMNLYTQHWYGRNRQHVDYHAIDKCFKKVRDTIPIHYRIGLPKIGAGLGGGEWERIFKYIERSLSGHDVTIINFP